MKRLNEFAPMMDADEGGSDGADTVTLDKKEADQLRRKAAEGEKAQRKLQAELEDLKQKLEDATANDDDLAKETKRADRAEKALEAANAKVTELEAGIEKAKRSETVKAVATRMGIRNPDLAAKLIAEEDQADEASVERAFKSLLKEEPYLKAPGNGQRDVTGPEETAPETKTETKALTPQQRMSQAYAQTGTKQKE
jgi:chromosome segregation ATPase